MVLQVTLSHSALIRYMAAASYRKHPEVAFAETMREIDRMLEKEGFDLRYPIGKTVTRSVTIFFQEGMSTEDEVSGDPTPVLHI